MYTLEEIEFDIETDKQLEHQFANTHLLSEKKMSLEDIIMYFKNECKEILEIQDMDIACKRLKTIRMMYNHTQNLPIWFRKVIFLVIYNYLKPIYEEIERDKLTKTKKKEMNFKKYYKTQSELLEEIGLVKDIFRKSHWNMYTPDKKAKQQVYISCNLPFHYAEVECNSIYRAMIHYMVCYADVFTDTFVDVFGKMGLPALFCANGYFKQVWVEDKYKLELFQEVMIHHPIKIYKMIQQLQYQLSRRSFSEQKQFVYELLQKYALSTFLAIKYKEAREDICKFGAEYFFVLCFQPEYWKDSNLIIKKDKNGERIVTYDLDMKKISRKKIEQFLQMTKEEFIYFAEQYKKIKVVEIHRNSAICLLKDQEQYYEEFDEEVLKNYRNLLYMDIPKYIREYQRFAFDSFQLIDILKLLVRYEGNWILTWKNYVHKEFAGEESDSLFHKIKIQDKEEEDISVDYLFSYLKIIEENLNRIHKELWVFKYRNKNKSDTNSIVFITNIQFPSISINDFLCRYFGTDTIKGTLTQETFSKFSKTAFKFDPQGL